ncbi:hypothetical protein L3C95_24075 [Chitinophaga filiformis]|uniref:hypothetical protein n=1 Tax=Chitinophaga filiformis TaxID=104663 RepID=UPI001F34815D|nr:hypothetical protein [Chitinophaga filiformis]MCF6406000.1 hypothetical protein [Chitinophaga filiformis]
MKKFAALQTKYLAQGVREDNIEYAISAVKDGSKREHILENLVADYRGMNTIEANRMLNEMFAANGGEFKKENRDGYLYGIALLLIGLVPAFYIFCLYTYRGVLDYSWEVWALAVSCFLGGISCIAMAILGKYRDSD